MCDDELFTLETLFDEVIEVGTITREDGGVDTHWHSYQISPDENLMMAVVMTVAAVKNTPPEQLDPLANIVDPDALTDLFAHARDKNRDTPLRVSFIYAGCEVVVKNRYIRVRECNG